ncbi:thioesterase superfamily protein [Kribbella flavida DSM 17836]|uniref:Thioesterase superfamily protein n=1 Tax=Kribbella flavida (strain DSM 17836 / JCM 10339 / NBRC 14399) TaxID=479435 RepID=D2PTJ7_KRIFD|nr:thioesterase family protein [Kribbella flavida]ADB31310.1 thioesterase superfamily protein [Kribbella flavida DSM 17836]
MSVFSHPVLVRWSDIDSYDHVNNVRYFDYLQEARIAFLAEIFGLGAEDLFTSSPVVLAGQTVDYLRPILLRHPPYVVDLWVESVGTSSFTLAAKIVDRVDGSELVYAKASSVLVAVTADTHTKRPLTDTERAALVGRISAA